MKTSIEIHAPSAAAWSLLTDTARWSLWGPTVVAADCPGRFIKAGSVGWVETVLGLRLPFRITIFDAGRRWCWEVAGIPATVHRVDPLGPDRCRVTFEVPLYATTYLAVCRLAEVRIKRILEEEHRTR